MITQKDISEQREQMQNDLLTILDGMDDDAILTQCCQVVVDRMKILEIKLDNQ